MTYAHGATRARTEAAHARVVAAERRATAAEAAADRRVASALARVHKIETQRFIPLDLRAEVQRLIPQVVARFGDTPELQATRRALIGDA